jgi:uncharacterized protein with HEPN domain
MSLTPSLVPTAEAAFIAGLNDRQMHRVMDSRFAHGYFDINLDVVWDTVQTDQ